jgi:hypothetical protein
MERVSSIQITLQELESEVITHTKANISREDQAIGKLVQRSIHDATIINDASSQFFTLERYLS